MMDPFTFLAVIVICATVCYVATLGAAWAADRMDQAAHIEELEELHSELELCRQQMAALKMQLDRK